MSKLGNASNIPQQAVAAKLMMCGAIRCMGCWQRFHSQAGLKVTDSAHDTSPDNYMQHTSFLCI